MDKKGEAVARVYLAAICEKQKRHQDAIDQLQISLSIAQEIGAQEVERIALSELGNNYLLLQDFNTSKGYLHRALDLHTQNNDPKQELITLGRLVSVYRGLKKEKDTAVYLAHCVALARQLITKGILKEAELSDEIKNLLH